ncbi:hypothetical protein L4D06_16570 [Enterovibrio makurazakiensis]|uniref:hypothetical protein n=1 Tax=Enterovibrio makurazakiensis TaxID=2910232 RepID=UPI003D221944
MKPLHFAVVGFFIGATSGALITYQVLSGDIETDEVANVIVRNFPVSEKASSIEVSKDTKIQEVDKPLNEKAHTINNIRVGNSDGGFVEEGTNEVWQTVDLEPSLVTNDLHLPKQGSERDDAYDALLLSTETNALFERFNQKHIEFRSENTAPEWQFETQQKIHDFFGLYVNKGGVNLDGIDCKSKTCELRVSGDLDSLQPGQAVWDFMKEQTIGFNGLVSIDSNDQTEQKRHFIYLIGISG